MFKSVQRGFTLIELVVVIVILGILAAFAVPRFINLQGQARVSVVRALEGSIRSAAALAHAAYIAEGATDGNVTMEGTTFAVNAGGYPTNATIDDALASYSGFNAPTVSGTVTTFAFTGGVAPCRVTYDTATTPPTIASNATGCD